MTITRSEKRLPILVNEAGDELQYGKLRYTYDLCWFCQLTEPEATVQGKGGAWYHLHPKGDTLSERQQALLRALDPDEFEAMFNGDGASRPVKFPLPEALQLESESELELGLDYSGDMAWRKRARPY